VLAWPHYHDALFSLGRLLSDTRRFEEAVAVWEQYLSLDAPPTKQASLASRYAALCRLELAQGGTCR
jgi:cytochrome c-type biogenesis protein CcmH/NrfG